MQGYIYSDDRSGGFGEFCFGEFCFGELLFGIGKKQFSFVQFSVQKF
jgi:hypothetical protein